METITRYSDNLIAYHMKKTKMVFDKPIYAGKCILDTSKTLMYYFHYNTIKKNYRDKAELLFTDIDSLCWCMFNLIYYIILNQVEHER